MEKLEITDAFDSIEVPTCGNTGPCVMKYDDWLRMEEAMSKLHQQLGGVCSSDD